MLASCACSNYLASTPTRMLAMNEPEEVTGKAKGGHARADVLSAEKRQDIARRAASARWNKDIPTATHEGTFKIGDLELACANLPGGKRIITQATFLRAIGRSRSPKAGTGVLSTVDELPFFLQANALKPFIDKALMESTKAEFYRSRSGGKGVGYDATLLPKVAEVYLKFRDNSLREKGEIPARYEGIIAASDILMRGLAHVGIVALVDEATGFQKDRARDDLAKILEAFVAKELQPWVKAFPSDFYEQLFRLRGIPFPGNGVKRPQYFGHLTNDAIYRRIAPGVLQELKQKAEKNEKGRLKHKLHQQLTPDFGHPKLRDMVTSVTTIMKLSRSWSDFKGKLDSIHPPYNVTLPIPFDDPNDTGVGI